MWASRLSASATAKTPQASALRWGGGNFLVLVLATSLWFVSISSFRADQYFPTQVVGWDELWARARRSFQTFPLLTTLPCQVLFNTLVENWDDNSAVGVQELVDKVRPEELAALASDSGSPRLYLALGALHQKAADTDPQYEERAGEYVEMARKLAPEIVETLVLMVS